MKRLLIFIVIVVFYNPIFSQNVSATFIKKDTLKHGDTLYLTLNIQKQVIKGFAKLELLLPIGFTPIASKDKGVSLIFTENILKYIWIELPSTTTITCNVPLIIDKRLYGKKEIVGKFHYVLNSQRQKIDLPKFSVFVENPRKTDIPENLMAIYKKKYEAPEFNEKSSTQTQYRVQIGAYSKPITKDILSEFYSNTDKIMEEKFPDFYKYTVGYFNDKEVADDFRKKCGVIGAFVVEYKNGVRQ